MKGILGDLGIEKAKAAIRSSRISEISGLIQLKLNALTLRGSPPAVK
jgi:hypothetical protein